jgi:hypothetical protein
MPGPGLLLVMLALAALAARGSSRAAAGSYGQLLADGTSRPLAAGSRVAQTIQVEQVGLYRIEVDLGRLPIQPPGPLVLHVTAEPFAGPDLAQVTLDASHLTAEGWAAFEFAPLAAPAGQQLAFWLEAPQAQPGSALTVLGARRDAYPGGQVLFEPAPAAGDIQDLAFKLYYRAGLLDALPVLLARQAAGRPGIFGWPPLYLLILAAYGLVLGGLLLLAYQRLRG